MTYMEIEETDESEGRDPFGPAPTRRSLQLAAEELVGTDFMPRDGATEGCEVDTVEDYLRTDGRPIEE